jgi:DNA-binding Lrp family transcriptional regulator
LAIADELGLTEREVIDRVLRLKQSGIIRRIGGNFVPGKLGYVSTLCAARVPVDQVPRFAAAVNRHPGVTHNYLRENAFNVWFTFIAPSMEEIEAKLKEISAETGVTEILNLPATRVFKIKAQFDV